MGIERWGPGDLHCAWWRLLLRSGGSWRDGGVVHAQAESARVYLHDRVLSVLAAFEGALRRRVQLPTLEGFTRRGR